jgi:hypothetical protein
MTNKQTLRERLLEVQKEIGTIKKDATNPFFKSKYFDINSLLEQIKPVLNEKNLIITQALTSLDGKLALKTSILDSDGIDGVVETCPLPDIQDPQKAGSAITYFRRYALQSLLALEAEDDDANLASTPKSPVNRSIKPSGVIKPTDSKIELPNEEPFIS